MFSDPDVAANVLQLMRHISGELNDSLIELETRVPRDEWVAYRYGVGGIMAEILGRVTYFIGEKHPELKSLIYGNEGGQASGSASARDDC